MTSRRFRGFAVLEREGGALVWNTFRPIEADALAVYQRHNPALADHPSPAQLVAVTIEIEPIKR